MERVKNLNQYQKGVLLLMSVMVLVFTVAYSIVISREGFAYKDVILIPGQENGAVVYSGKIQGEQARFIVSADKTVEFQYGEKTYGPYTAKEDPTAIPKGEEMSEYMTGVELRCGEKIIFRGAVQKYEDLCLIYNEDGSLEDSGIIVITSDGIEVDENGNVIDPMEPSVATILDLMDEPELTHKGEWIEWFLGVILCIGIAISILFVDELFRLHLSFQIRDVGRVEPSDLEIAGRYITWTIMPVMALLLFIMGLQ